MKKKVILIVLLSSLFHSASFCQVDTTRRNFNIGISEGLGGSFFFRFIPALDFRYKNINLRVAPQPGAIGGGISYEILPFSNIYKDAYWIASVYGSYGTYTQSIVDTNIKSSDPYSNSKISYYSIMGMTGVKLYLGGRAYSQLQIGAIHTNNKNVFKYNNSNFTSLYLEFSIGINLFRNRPKAEEVGVEEE